MKYLLYLLVFAAHSAIGQNSTISSIIEKIDFQEDTIKSVYDYVTNTIKYDVAKLKVIEERKKPSQKANQVSVEEHEQQRLEKIIKTKKGVCEDYSLLFHSIVTELGYSSHIVVGVSKDSKGNVRNRTGHAWNVVKTNNTWKLYDTTWGAGFVNDKGKFVRKINTAWFEVDAKTMSETHLPFDPIWQLNSAPITYLQFAGSKKASSQELSYDFKNLIKTHFAKNEKEQLIDLLERSNYYGDELSLLNKWRKNLQNKLDLFDLITQPNRIPIAFNKCKSATDLFNNYVNKARNKNFKNKKWTVAYSKEALIEAQELLNSAIQTFDSMDIKDKKASRQLTSSKSQATKLLTKVKSEIKYLDRLN